MPSLVGSEMCIRDSPTTRLMSKEDPTPPRTLQKPQNPPPQPANEDSTSEEEDAPDIWSDELFPLNITPFSDNDSNDPDPDYIAFEDSSSNFSDDTGEEPRPRLYRTRRLNIQFLRRRRRRRLRRQRRRRRRPRRQHGRTKSTTTNSLQRATQLRHSFHGQPRSRWPGLRGSY